MRPRLRTTADLGGFQGWWSTVPPLTKLLGSVWLGTALGAGVGLAPIGLMAMSWKLVLRKLQVWRLLTTAGFLAQLSPRFAFRMMWLFVYSSPLEQTMTAYNPGEYAFMLLFSIVMFNLISIVIPIYFCASPLVFTILYLWSQNFSNQDVSIWGLVTIKAFYLPWAFLGIDLLMGHPISALTNDVVGMCVGHVYYFLTTLYPRSTQNQILKCPIWLSRAMGQFYKSQSGASVQAPPSRPGENRTAGNRSGFRAFQGQGRRLVD